MTATAAPPVNKPALANIPEEVKPKRKKRQFVFANAEELKTAAEALKSSGKKGGSKQFEVPLNGKTFFVMGHSQKDAFAKACLHLGLEAKRLDAEDKPERKKREVTTDDVLSLINKADAMPTEERQKLVEALKKLTAAKPK